MAPLDISGSDTLVTVIKWAATLIAAGFIAQFGKKFADYLIDKGKKRRTEKTGVSTEESHSAAVSHIEKEKAGDKLFKKERKTLIKEMKKRK